MDEKVELYEDVYDKKFSFGKNWSNYLKLLDKSKIELAKKSLREFTCLKSFKDKTFVDIGCGSGLFSLSAVLLGAKNVVSVDVDENSVNCARYLRKKYKIDENKWVIKRGSALDEKFLKSLGKFDIVYSWGVLHHTGSMWKALDNISVLNKKDSLLYIAIYNDFKGFISSKTWVKIKRYYSGSNKFTRKIMEGIYFCYLFFGVSVHLRNPFSYINNYGKNSLRGMSFYYDMVDWLGGYPFEYASVKEIKEFYEKRGFKLIKVKETKREGCNQFVFKNG